MGAFGGPNIVEDGLVFSADAGNKQCYISGSASPDIIIDSIKGAQGTVDNTINYNPTNGGYWEFDGSDSDIALGAQTAGQWSSDPCTFEFWVNLDSSAVTDILWMDRTVWNGTTGTEIWMEGSGGKGNFRGRGAGNGSSSPYVETGLILSFDTWYHLVFTCNSTTGTLFVNGEQKASGTIMAVADSTSNSYIGAYGNGTSFEFTGNVAIVRIYHKALTTSEVLQNYTVTKDRFGL